MSEKEKARPAGSAAEQAGQGNHWESGIPCNQYNVRGGCRQFEIADLLSHEHGYYLPSSGEDRAACVRSLRGRAKEILNEADAIEAAEE